MDVASFSICLYAATCCWRSPNSNRAERCCSADIFLKASGFNFPPNRSSNCDPFAGLILVRVRKAACKACISCKALLVLSPPSLPSLDTMSFSSFSTSLRAAFLAFAICATEASPCLEMAVKSVSGGVSSLNILFNCALTRSFALSGLEGIRFSKTSISGVLAIRAPAYSVLCRNCRMIT